MKVCNTFISIKYRNISFYFHFRLILIQIQAIKGKGISFRVSAQSDIQTNADYRVPSTKEIANILTWIVKRMTDIE